MITFLKLGGSLITDKDTPHTARPEVIRGLAKEISAYWNSTHEPLLIGHGSGSFGHVPAKRFQTRNGVHTNEEWAGFAEVHAEATALNRIVTDILQSEGLPVLSFVPMDAVRTTNGIITQWDTSAIKDCFERNLIPLVFGDTVFDTEMGGTICSTEDLFFHLCKTLHMPARILLAGLEEGVWRDFPQRNSLVSKIYADISADDDSYIYGSAFTDVTGGMMEKVRLMKSVVSEKTAHSAVIFAGQPFENLSKALRDEPVGTKILLFNR